MLRRSSAKGAPQGFWGAGKERPHGAPIWRRIRAALPALPAQPSDPSRFSARHGPAPAAPSGPWAQSGLPRGEDRKRPDLGQPPGEDQRSGRESGARQGPCPTGRGGRPAGGSGASGPRAPGAGARPRGRVTGSASCGPAVPSLPWLRLGVIDAGAGPGPLPAPVTLG